MVQTQKIPCSFTSCSEGLLKKISSLGCGEFLEVKSSDILASLRECLALEASKGCDGDHRKKSHQLVAHLCDRVRQLNTLQIFIKEGIINGTVATDENTPVYAYVTGLTKKGKTFFEGSCS